MILDTASVVAERLDNFLDLIFFQIGVVADTDFELAFAHGCGIEGVEAGLHVNDVHIRQRLLHLTCALKSR